MNKKSLHQGKENFGLKLSQRFYQSAIGSRRNSALGVKIGKEYSSISIYLGDQIGIDLMQPIFNSHYQVITKKKRMYSKEVKHRNVLNKDLQVLDKNNLNNKRESESLKIIG